MVLSLIPVMPAQVLSIKNGDYLMISINGSLMFADKIINIKPVDVDKDNTAVCRGIRPASYLV